MKFRILTILVIIFCFIMISVTSASHCFNHEKGEPDLDCDGYLSWSEVELGSTIYHNFTVENIGDPDSELSWEIYSYPDWGCWTFTPEYGENLTPENSPVTVQVQLVVPDEQIIEFDGYVRIINIENQSDYCDIFVYLTSVPTVSITKPERAIYLNNKQIMWFFIPLIIGNDDIEVQASASSMIDWVEFYIDDELVHIDSTKPYTWMWTKTPSGIHEIKIKAHEPSKQYFNSRLIVWKLF